MDKIIDKIKGALKTGDVLTGDDVHSRSAGSWGSPGNIRAKAIVRPETTEEVSAVLRICSEAGQSIVTHGGLTGVVQGAIAEENDIVLSLELMNEIEEIDKVNRTATVQAGVVLQSLQEAARDEGLMMPLDLGARGSCTIGGNIATNAGGVSVMRYGMMRESTLGLEVVLADGTVLSSMNQMIKNNAGYDLKHLFIGSEGTLGVVTRAVVRLREAPTSQNTAFVALDDFDKAAKLLKLVDGLSGGTLHAFELFWHDFYILVSTPPAQAAAPLSYEFPYYVLIETQGSHQEADAERFQNMLETAMQHDLIADAAIAQTAKERATMWEMRDDVQQLWQYEPMFMFDVSLPIPEMNNYMQEVDKNLSKTWPLFEFFAFGHLADGNLHLAVSAGEDDAETTKIVNECVYAPLKKIGGSISAEHGIGMEKKDYLKYSRTPEELALMQALKKTLDPKRILNPGRVFDLE